MDAFTVGVNDFVNKNVRVTLDYLTYKISNIDTSKNIDGRSVKDSSDAVQLRLQYAF
ncbi:porin [Pantoea sp. A4]|uniref:porin n=1 Tax=Pantoea sp. A4 TaxID=1225184 RepID=UPI0012EDBC06|nr:porin [Pantoea sp. A4]